MKTHHMVQAQHARVAHLETEDIAQVTIALLAQPLRMQRSKSPILPFAEKRVRRRAHVDAGRKSIAFAPKIVTRRMYAQRQVEIKLNAARTASICKSGNLFLREP